MKKTICILHPGVWDAETPYSRTFVEALNRIKNPDTLFWIKIKVFPHG